MYVHIYIYIHIYIYMHVFMYLYNDTFLYIIITIHTFLEVLALLVIPSVWFTIFKWKPFKTPIRYKTNGLFD